MKHFPKIISLCSVLACVLAGGALADNPVPNGDFEKEENGALAGWLPLDTINYSIPNNIHGTGNGFSDYIWDTASADGGKGSLLIKGRGIRVPETVKRLSDQIDSVASQKVPVQGDTEYRLTFAYRAEGIQPHQGQGLCAAGVGIHFASGEFQPGYLGHIGYIIDRWGASNIIPGRPNDGPVTPGDITLQVPDNSSEWKKMEFVFKTPSGTTKLDVRPSVTCWIPSHPFAVWFDNFSIEPVDGSKIAAQDSQAWKGRTLPPQTGHSLATGEPELLPPAIPYGSGIQRTMKLLATSTPEHRNRVNILCYGQSIMCQPWWYKIYGDLKKRYPNADIVMENRSMGGMMSNELRLTAEADLYPTWPDLVLMHDYVANGKSGEGSSMEQIFANLRARTTSEMLVYTFHSSFPGKYDSPNMFQNYKKIHDVDSELIRTLAGKYGYEVVEARQNWEKTIKELFPTLDFRFAMNWFLYEQIHTHPRGQRLYHYLSMPHFVYNPDAEPTWLDSIKVYLPDGKRWPQDKAEYPADGVVLDKTLKFDFEGSRIDLMANPLKDGKPGSAKVLIDGKLPSAFPEVYVATRTTPKPNSTWPMIERVQLGKTPVAEDWTLTYTTVNPAKSKPELDKPDTFDFDFELKGSVTGADGKGNNKERFVSNSGRIILDPTWYLPPSKLMGFVPTVGSDVKWKSLPIALDVWQQNANVDPATEDRYTLAQGISNGKHTLEIIPNGDGPLSLRALVVYHPPTVGMPPEPDSSIQPPLTPASTAK